MDIIQVLPDSVANQIAAGEVIQRPASVIKELVENAIDAGATTIQVLVVDAGKTSIQVIDDGCGMSDTDARLSFDRHATSKIRKADDLFSLHTMGFRGEALASIAAVAQVTLKTRLASDEIGTKISIAGGKVINQEATACPVGSNFLIENLFYNIPVRRKFLKSNTTEMSNITQAFERIVLVYPKVSFVLFHNGQEVLNLRAGSLRQRIVDVFGKKLNQQLLDIETDTTLCKIKGFVGKPENAKKKGSHQYFFVNGRYMKHAYFHSAVQKAFERLVPAGEQVHYFIYLDVPPEDIDVNIHPVKTEIKFENDQAIWQIMLAAVRDAVGKFSGLTEIDFNTENMPDIPVYNPASGKDVAIPKVDFDTSYNPFKSTQQSRQLSNWETLYDKIDKVSASGTTSNAMEEELFPSSILDEPVQNASPYDEMSEEHLQYRGSYIMTQVAGGLMVVDQHRAHTCILFEEYMRELANNNAHTQRLIFPDVVQFPPNYNEKLPAIIDTLQLLGFEITDIGGNSYSISGIPGGLTGLDPVSLVNELVTAAVEMSVDVTQEVNRELALRLAYRAATPYGEILTNEEMHKLLTQLMECDNQNYTPDGKPVVILLESNDIESRFR